MNILKDLAELLFSFLVFLKNLYVLYFSDEFLTFLSLYHLRMQ